VDLQILNSLNTMRIHRKPSAAALLTLSLCVPPTFSADAGSQHGKEFWKQIAQNDFRVPAGESAPALIMDLSESLGSPDPELRDELAYEISAAWIYRDQRLSGSELLPLVHKCKSNLRHGVGQNGTDSVFLRSFSALELSLVAALDLKKPVLSDGEFEQLLTAALNYMNAERDLRGYDPQKGWMHATAHTADLLKFLGRDARLKPADQARILDAIAGKLRQRHVFVFGENERMAAAVLSLIRRKDFDRSGFDNWLSHFAQQDVSLWASPELDTTEFAAMQNAKDLLRSLFVQMNLTQAQETNEEPTKAAVLGCLKQLR
jgi:hypothetical protein